MNLDDVWIMVPARGGSRGLPRKNARLLGGKPLLWWVLDAALGAVAGERIVVVTDDDEIDALACAKGVRVVREPETTGRATLDDVALRTAADLFAFGAKATDILLTLQPTCPFVRSARIGEAALALENGAGSVVTVADDRHLGWRLGADGQPTPDYAARVNRQQLPAQYRETGAVIGCRLGALQQQGTRILPPIRLLGLDKAEALDIDDFHDWAIAREIASRRRILIRADAGVTLGMGHAYRALALAQELARHAITLATARAGRLGHALLSQYPFEVVEVDGDADFIALAAERRPDLIVLDQLDTTAAYVQALQAKERHVVTFEDQGTGALRADLLVSDLYENLAVPGERQLSGIENAILAPSFETLREPAPFREDVASILVVFGGTDPSNLTHKALAALAAAQFAGEVHVIAGPGNRQAGALDTHGLRARVHSGVKYMPGLFRQVDLALSSAGRTITELLCCGIPVLCMCQNDKELTHTHASARHGVINLGLGSLVDVQTLAAHIQRLCTASGLRQLLRERAIHETRSRANAAVIGRIMQRIGWAEPGACG
ncbi:cytidylyltransferase domain-containing protein [Thiohalocapsa sp. ML1]|uniref:cytidylyltransferase domain-containing protein n=1 Tax=Thiohalocapsa sp. ML1 TaxID=1431688 RepID=UPI0007320DCB|nr:NTP transferase domain-containing protein [Thiohalocapsa sp. ML1]